jgi:hypothetical protein
MIELALVRDYVRVRPRRRHEIVVSHQLADSGPGAITGRRPGVETASSSWSDSPPCTRPGS